MSKNQEEFSRTSLILPKVNQSFHSSMKLHSNRILDRRSMSFLEMNNSQLSTELSTQRGILLCHPSFGVRGKSIQKLKNEKAPLELVKIEHVKEPKKPQKVVHTSVDIQQVLTQSGPIETEE